MPPAEPTPPGNNFPAGNCREGTLETLEVIKGELISETGGVWEEEDKVGVETISQEHPLQAGTLLSPVSSFWIFFGYPFRPK